MTASTTAQLIFEDVRAPTDAAVDHARRRRQFDRPIIEFQGLAFLLADMATAVEAARALYLAAARRRDAGRPYGPQAAMAKLFASDMAMRVTTDAVQALGGYGYVQDFPVVLSPRRWLLRYRSVSVRYGRCETSMSVCTDEAGN